MIVPLSLAGLATLGSMGFFARKERRHTDLLAHLDYNVHVNGIRGKSTVTRMIGGALRGAGVPTISKTTGTYACVIDTEADEHPIRRTGPANIAEQYEFLRQWADAHVTGLVVECMAVKPKYQNICQHHILRSPVCVITNVRLDHQDEMGDSLEEIAASLCNTVPQDGVVITGERKPEIVEVMRAEAEKRNATLIVAERTEESEQLVERFNYHQFEENVAVGLAVIDYLNLNREAAIAGMIAAEPDPGTTTVTRLERKEGGNLFWAPMFAVNDWESTTKVYRSLSEKKLDNQCRRVNALNNRADRTDRATMFVNVVAQDLLGEFDRIVLYGDLQDAVHKALINKGVDDSLICTTMDVDDEDGTALLDCATAGFGQDSVAVFGMVNIHTTAVSAMRRHVTSLVDSQAQYQAVYK
ncbi:poly-gamma-glutamate synthase PgsB [Corynebacterium yudongzhengii]|uniref:Poly-gamma-glutamate synthase PgsB n=1 Tax=Corynebacterium yudongzhengii TaxID=2080740 RepID=A0A2U1T852_9CORY|nr:poly-gamma-glutamate synthase PgsB [Corynebacterium yudongzhengii]AWB82756.1 poly-gamma-glutamate synthase PgsB [Corynebacterium yudongzhengii]PWC02184.1 poly-gamma-glutamate synthase PgsB [Corynebacterium yudongzhengii]